MGICSLYTSRILILTEPRLNNDTACQRGANPFLGQLTCQALTTLQACIASPLTLVMYRIIRIPRPCNYRSTEVIELRTVGYDPAPAQDSLNCTAVPRKAALSQSPCYGLQCVPYCLLYNPRCRSWCNIATREPLALDLETTSTCATTRSRIPHPRYRSESKPNTARHPSTICMRTDVSPPSRIRPFRCQGLANNL